MHVLTNNCRVGKFSVFPANWKAAAADMKLIWRINYWFYDDNLKQKKQVKIMGMNNLESLKQRQDYIKVALKSELEDLQNGYNPISGVYPDASGSEINKDTGLLDALNYALNKIDVVHNTWLDIDGALRFMTLAIKDLHYQMLAVQEVKRKHIKDILERCSKIKTYTDKKGKVREKKWGSYQYNRYKSYLSILFTEIVDSEIIDSNPVWKIKKKPHLKKIRETTTEEERIKIREYTKLNFYPFYRFLQIFFQSGSRETEMLNVKKTDVRLSEQKFKITVKKGKKFTEEWRTITDLALPFWIEVYNLATSNQYLFSKGLVPGDKNIRAEQLTRRWRRHIKNKLDVNADLYSLKYTFLDAIAELGEESGVKEAQKAAGHSTPVITMIYLHGEEERQHQRKKKVRVNF